MNAVIYPSKISGNVNIPPSKSYTHRALILASLAYGKSTILNILISEDTRATIKALINLGVNILLNGNKAAIQGTNGRFIIPSGITTLNVGDSGTSLRLLTAISSLTNGEVIITGSKRLCERPVGELIDALQKLGIIAKAQGKNRQYPPVKITGGKLKGTIIDIDSKESSQYLSALLLIVPFAEHDTEITVNNLRSKPYVDITMDLMKTFGVKVEVNGNRYFVKSGQHYQAQKYTVEGDYSSASYFFAANALGSAIKINGLKPHSVQPDKELPGLLKKVPGTFDMNELPDAVPSLVIVAAYKQGKTTITNIGHLRTKESDRIRAIANNLTKMGIKVEENATQIKIYGGTPLGAEIDTYNDHRIAMSFAIAALSANGKTVIINAEVVNKSYPDFWKDLDKLGAKIEYKR